MTVFLSVVIVVQSVVTVALSVVSVALSVVTVALSVVTVALSVATVFLSVVTDPLPRCQAHELDAEWSLDREGLSSNGFQIEFVSEMWQLISETVNRETSPFKIPTTADLSPSIYFKLKYSVV